MVERAEIKEEVSETVEVIKTGQWWIVSGEYNGLESAAQSNISRQKAIDNLVNRFYKRERRAEKHKEEREFREEMSELRREIAEEQLERTFDGKR